MSIGPGRTKRKCCPVDVSLMVKLSRVMPATATAWMETPSPRSKSHSSSPLLPPVGEERDGLAAEAVDRFARR